MDLKTIKPGDIVTVSDEQEIAASMEAGKGASGCDFTVLDTERFIFTVDGQGECCHLLLVKLTDDTHLAVEWFSGSDRESYRMLVIPDEIDPDNVRGVVASGGEWLFNEPEDIHQVVYPDLELVDEIVCSDGNTFRKTCQRSGHRRDSSSSVTFAMLTQYQVVEENIQNDAFWVLETGGLDEDGDAIQEGGFLRVFTGGTVVPGDLEHLPAIPEA